MSMKPMLVASLVPEEPKIRVHIGMPRATKPKAIGTMATAVVRSLGDVRHGRLRCRPHGPNRAMRGSSAAINETVMMACGRPHTSWALA